MLEHAARIEERKLALENVAPDDGKTLSNLTEDEIITEAVYTLELFHREGTIE